MKDFTIIVRSTIGTYVVDTRAHSATDALANVTHDIDRDGYVHGRRAPDKNDGWIKLYPEHIGAVEVHER